MDLKERIAWLRRMPTHYRVLFGTQLIFTVWLISRRQQNLAQRHDSLKNNQQDSAIDAATTGGGTVIQAVDELTPPKDARQVYQEILKRNKNDK